MNAPYEEIVDGLSMLRLPPGIRHEQVCNRLHARVAACLDGSAVARLLPPRAAVALRPDTLLRPDLAIVTAAHEKLLLAVEVVSPTDHEADTVTKKMLYEDVRIPRLWMVDPRYDNVEVYHGTPYGLMLRGILAGAEVLSEKLVPGFRITIDELFAPPVSNAEP